LSKKVKINIQNKKCEKKIIKVTKTCDQRKYNLPLETYLWKIERDHVCSVFEFGKRAQISLSLLIPCYVVGSCFGQKKAQLYKMKESKTPSYKQNNPLLAISYNPKPTM
jgi:hypothetical protein